MPNTSIPMPATAVWAAWMSVLKICILACWSTVTCTMMGSAAFFSFKARFAPRIAALVSRMSCCVSNNSTSTPPSIKPSNLQVKVFLDLFERGLAQIGLGAGHDVVGRTDGTGHEQSAAVVLGTVFVSLHRIACDLAADAVELLRDRLEIAGGKVESFRQGLDVRGVDAGKVEFLETQGRRTEGVGLDDIRAGLKVLQMDAFQILWPGKHQKIGQHLELFTAERRIGEFQVLHHGSHGAIHDQYFFF